MTRYLPALPFTTAGTALDHGSPLLQVGIALVATPLLFRTPGGMAIVTSNVPSVTLAPSCPSRLASLAEEILSSNFLSSLHPFACSSTHSCVQALLAGSFYWAVTLRRSEIFLSIACVENSDGVLRFLKMQRLALLCEQWTDT